MRSEEFWDLSWGEWIGWIGKIHTDLRRVEQERNHTLELSRHWFALFCQVSTGKPFGPDEFLQPKKETPEQEGPKETPEEFFERMSKTRFVKRKKK